MEIVERKRASSSLVCCSYFDGICDELVVEILIKLPIKAVHRCKCISKRCRDLISTHRFVTSYIRHQERSKPTPFCLFYQNSDLYEILRHPKNNTISSFYATDTPLFQSPGFSMSSSSLPSLPSVLASSNGLVLCSQSLVNQTRYLVCNPLTNCWVSTPSPPTSHLRRSYIGFLCKAMNLDTVNNSSCGFVIVRIPNYGGEERPSIRKVEIYDSENGQWAEFDLDGGWARDFERFMFGLYFKRTRLTAVACKGLLHWSSHNLVFVYKPSIYTATNNNNRCKIIKLPPLENWLITVDDSFLGECKGKLMYARFQCRTCEVWQLKDHDNNGGEWGLLHNVLFDQTVFFGQPFDIEYSDENETQITFLAFHPFDEDIVFICTMGFQVQVCNIREKTLTHTFFLQLEGIHHNDSMPYLVVLPWWPVPLCPVHSSPLLN